MYNAFVRQYHTTLFTFQATITIILIFFHRRRSLNYTFVLLQLLIKYVYTKNDRNLLLDLEPMAAILGFLPTMQCLKYFPTTPLCQTYLKTL